MRNKYFLYIINKKKYSENIIDLLKDFLYIYKYRDDYLYHLRVLLVLLRVKGVFGIVVAMTVQYVFCLEIH